MAMMDRKHNRLPALAVFASVLALITSNATSFSIAPTLSAGTPDTALFATEKSPKRPPTGGFGAAVRSAKPKTRVVTGNAGSGTKPLRAAANAFDALRRAHGKGCCADVYCKNPLDDPLRLWFVGKVAVDAESAFTTAMAAVSQKRLILEYAKRELRPQNLAIPAFAPLELWLAPPDSEMDAVQNKIPLTKITSEELPEDFDVKLVGYNPEIYVGDEKRDGGLRIWRDDEGNTVRPVIETN